MASTPPTPAPTAIGPGHIAVIGLLMGSLAFFIITIFGHTAPDANRPAPPIEIPVATLLTAPIMTGPTLPSNGTPTSTVPSPSPHPTATPRSTTTPRSTATPHPLTVTPVSQAPPPTPTRTIP